MPPLIFQYVYDVFYVSAYIYVYMYVHIYIYIYTPIYIYIYIYLHISLFVFIYRKSTGACRAAWLSQEYSTVLHIIELIVNYTVKFAEPAPKRSLAAATENLLNVAMFLSTLKYNEVFAVSLLFSLRYNTVLQ